MKKFIFSKFAGLQAYSQQLYYQMNSTTGISQQNFKPPHAPPMYWLKPQLWPLTANCFKVSSQSYLADLSKICFLSTYVDQLIIQQRLVFCIKFNFTIFLLMFLPFSKVVTNILKIYELPKASIVHNNHLPGQFYVTTSSGFWTLLKMYTWGQRTLLELNLKKNPR